MDVASHFGLVHLPFRATIAPEDAWFGGPFAEVVTTVSTRLRAGDRVIALVGPPGSGKSLALRTIAKRLGDAGKVVRHAGLADQLGGELPAEGILLVDEADAADPDMLARLQAAAHRRFQLVLAGEGSFLARLDPAAAITPVRLSLLGAADARAFLLDRLARCGNADLYEPAAFDKVVALGGGAPRRIGTIAGSALLEAALDGAGAVAPRHVERAQAMHASLAGRRAIEPADEVHEAPGTADAPRPDPPAAPVGIRRLTAAQDGRLAALIALVFAVVALPLVAWVESPPDAAGVRPPSVVRPLPATTPPRAAAAPPSQPAASPAIVEAPAVPTAPLPVPAPPIPGEEITAAPRAAAPGPPTVESATATPRPDSTAPMPTPAPNARAPARATAGPAPRRDPPRAPAVQVAVSDPPAPVAPATAADAPAAPAGAPTTARSDLGAAADRCACPEGMSAARCNEWKAWNCRSED